MKAITVIPGKAGVSLSDLNDVQQQPNSVKVKTLYTGICGTDREITAGRLGITRPEAGNSLVLGHEAVGVIESASYKSDFSAGDIVVPMVRRPGGCVNCRDGRQDYCLDGDFNEAGIRGKNGFMREYFYEDPKFLIKVSNSANAAVCVMSEPTKNIMKILEAVVSVSKRPFWDLSGGLDGKGVWIFGTGAEGLLASAVFKNAGADTVLANRRSLVGAELAVSQKTGSKVFDSSKDDIDALINDINMDVVIDTVGVPKILEDCIPRLNRNGIVVLFGTGGQGVSSLLDGGAIIRLVDKNATIVGCEDGCHDNYVQAVKFIEEQHDHYGLDQIITGHYGNDQLDVLREKIAGEIKCVIDW